MWPAVWRADRLAVSGAPVKSLLCSVAHSSSRSDLRRHKLGALRRQEKREKRKEAALSVLHGKSKKRKKVTSKSFSWQSPGKPGHYVDDDRFK